MNANNFESELRTPRWGLDLVVCSMVACGLCVGVIWFSPFALPKPQNVIGGLLVIILSYTLSVFAGHIIKIKEWSTAVWVPVVGSVFIPLIWIGRLIPGSIEHYFRFTPEPTLFRYLFKSFASEMFWIAVAFTVFTIIPAFAARGLVWIYRRFSNFA
jgi:hypothetical protein